MLPHIHGEDGCCATGDGVLSVARLGDCEVTVLNHQPRPATAELGCSSCRKLLLEVVHGSEGLLDGLLQLALQLCTGKTQC